MSKNILIISGSPRKGGNTDILAEAFSEGAIAKGHTVNTFRAGNKKIGPCLACDTCWSKGRACSIDDDFVELEPLLEQADVLVLATPLYWFTFSAQLKAALDKLYAYDVPSRQQSLKIKEAVLLACAAGEDKKIFVGLEETFKTILDYIGWKNAGILSVPGVYEKGDIRGTDALEQAKQMGQSI